MDIGRPHRIVTGEADLDILRVLAGSRSPMTGRQVARLAGRSQTTALRALNRLADAGVLDVSEAGRALMFSLNREHLATPAIESLLSLRAQLIEALSREASALEPVPLSASLFGSAARGDGDTASDIDLLLVRRSGDPRDAWSEQLSGIAERVHRMTGNRLSIHELEESDLERLHAERAPILAELERDAVDLAGEPIRELLRAAAR